MGWYNQYVQKVVFNKIGCIADTENNLHSQDIVKNHNHHIVGGHFQIHFLTVQTLKTAI